MFLLRHYTNINLLSLGFIFDAICQSLLFYCVRACWAHVHILWATQREVFEGINWIRNWHPHAHYVAMIQSSLSSSKKENSQLKIHSHLNSKYTNARWRFSCATAHGQACRTEKWSGGFGLFFNILVGKICWSASARTTSRKPSFRVWVWTTGICCTLMTIFRIMMNG